MQDDSGPEIHVIELLAKALDEPLSATEQREVDAAMQESLALRLAAEGLNEFDNLLKRTGMVIPADGFPGRVIARIEDYERRRTRTQWYLTLGILFLGLCAAVLFFVLEFSLIVDGVVQGVTLLAEVLPVWFSDLFILTGSLGNGTLLLLAVFVLACTVLWVRASGGMVPAHNPR